jgi:hypothetical protein
MMTPFSPESPDVLQMRLPGDCVDGAVSAWAWEQLSCLMARDNAMEVRADPQVAKRLRGPCGSFHCLSIQPEYPLASPAQGPTLYCVELSAFQLDSVDERGAGTVGNKAYTYEDPPRMSILKSALLV